MRRGVRLGRAEIGPLVRGLERSFGVSILHVTIVGIALVVIKLILFPFDLNPSSCQDLLYGGAIELDEILIELIISEESFLEGVDRGLLVVKWNGYLFSVEVSDIVTE